MSNIKFLVDNFFLLWFKKYHPLSSGCHVYNEKSAILLKIHCTFFSKIFPLSNCNVSLCGFLWVYFSLRKGGEGDDRGQVGRMASPTQWTWVWDSSRQLWRTGKPCVLQSMRSQNQARLSDWTLFSDFFELRYCVD